VSTAGRGRAEQPRSTLLQLPPPSIVKRAGPAPGGIAGIPEDWIRNPDRTHGEPYAAVPLAAPVARPVAVDPVGGAPARRHRLPAGPPGRLMLHQVCTPGQAMLSSTADRALTASARPIPQTARLSRGARRVTRRGGLR
jgi:hypothetical protein